jgi:hypothetical protein
MPPLIHPALHYPSDLIRLAPDGIFLPVRFSEQAHFATGQKNTLSKAEGHLLPDLDSNQDKQNQNLSYYHYTIGQSVSLKRSAKIRAGGRCSKRISTPAAAPGPLNKLKQQRQYGIDQRRRENPFRRTVLM